jgi:hypothetical protein
MDSCTASTPYALICLCDLCAQNGNLGQIRNDDVDMDSSANLDDYPESSASNSSCPPLSISTSTEVTSDCSWPSSAQKSFNEQISSMLADPEPLTTWPDSAGMQTRISDPEDTYIYPQLPSLDVTLSDTWHASGYRDLKDSSRIAGDDTLVQKTNEHTLCSPFQVFHEQHATNDFDHVFNDLQATTSDIEQDVSWLVNWATRYPNTYPKMEKLKSLQYLSGMSEADIVAWLREHFDNQTNSKVDLMVTDTGQPPRSQRAPRYQPKCLKSRRRFRHVPETPKATKIFECTRRCGESFKKKGDWKRHELYNIEEWRCHICDFAPSRKDKLPKHLQDCHGYYSHPKKSHCRQLLHASARPCGFCGMQFHDWSTWLNHVAAHFEGDIPGGPWTMARWSRDIAQDLGWGENDDDDDDDDGDGDDGDNQDNHDNHEDEGGHDSSDNGAKRLDDQSTKGKGASSGGGAKGSSRASRSSKSQSTGSHTSKSNAAGVEALVTEMSTSLSPTRGDEQQNLKSIWRGGERGCGEIEFTKETASLQKSQDHASTTDKFADYTLVLGGSPNLVANATQTADLGGKSSLKRSASNVDHSGGRRKVLLSEGAAFHVPSSPPTENELALSIHHPPRLSPTCSSSWLMSPIFEKEDITTNLFVDFDDAYTDAYRRPLDGYRLGFGDPVGIGGSEAPVHNIPAKGSHYTTHPVPSPSVAKHCQQTDQTRHGNRYYLDKGDDILRSSEIEASEPTDFRGTHSERKELNPNYKEGNDVVPFFTRGGVFGTAERIARRPRPTAESSQPQNRGDAPAMTGAASVLERENYPVGCICALASEMAAAKAMLDQRHASLQVKEHDSNTYQLGSIGSHNVVTACLPLGVTGTTSAATVAESARENQSTQKPNSRRSDKRHQIRGQSDWDIYHHSRRMALVRESRAYRGFTPIITYNYNCNNKGVLSPGISDQDIQAHARIYLTEQAFSTTARQKIGQRPGLPVDDIQRTAEVAGQRDSCFPYHCDKGKCTPHLRSMDNARCVNCELSHQTPGWTMKPTALNHILCHPFTVTHTGLRGCAQKGHWSSVYAVVFSPDGKPLASAPDDRSVRLWDAATGASLQTLEGHSSTWHDSNCKKCTRCNQSEPDAEHFHPAHKGKVPCHRKDIADGGNARVFIRKDKLIEHLKAFHRHLNPKQIIDKWKFTTKDNFPRRCGFCGKSFDTWEQRNDCIAQHFQAGGSSINALALSPDGNQLVGFYVLFDQHEYSAAKASVNAPVGVSVRNCHQSLLSSHTGHHAYKNLGTANFGSSGFANMQHLPEGKVSSGVCHEFTTCSLQTACPPAGRDDLYADRGAHCKGILNTIYATQGKPGKHTSRGEEYGNDKSHCDEDALVICDIGGGTVDLAPYDLPRGGPHEAKSSFPTIEARESASRNCVAALRPRTASFDTIRKLYGVKDRGRLARFKMERFLNEPDDNCCWEAFWERSMETDAPEDNLSCSVNRTWKYRVPDNRLLSGEDSCYLAGVASSLIPGASRRG